MARRRGIRIKKGLPRGGLGHAGSLVGLASLAVALFVRADVAVTVCVLLLPVCIWCGLGLRKDASAGEISDEWIDDESLDWRELLSGNFESPVRRHSTGIVVLASAALVIAVCRLSFGWGPVPLNALWTALFRIRPSGEHLV